MDKRDNGRTQTLIPFDASNGKPSMQNVERMPMNLREKSLYHQIYPTRLLTDWITTVPWLYLLWKHMLVLGLAVTFIP